MRAEILSIGTELLLGYISDTNATYLAQQLSALGIDLYFVSQVGDNLDRLRETLQRAHDRSDIVVMTGGLGPTEDDLSREAIAAVLGETPQVDPQLEADLRAFFASRDIVMPERNIKQAWVIPSVTPLANPNGTAPGWWAEREGKVIVAMPGVPHEMKAMWESEVVPRLRPLTGAILFTKTLRVAGLGESSVEERLQALLHSNNPTLATYAKRDAVDVRITAKAATEAEARAQVATVEAQARELLGAHVFGVDSDTPQSVALTMLIERGLTLATMESCTGGLVASLLTDVPGSSNAFVSGFVAYSAEMKMQWGVPRETIDTFGVISVETARAMAEASRERLGASIGIGITGIAGPDAQEGKPVGTVHIAVASDGRVSDTSQRFRGARTEIKWRAAITALNLLRLHLHREG
ncbi:MAG: ADP-ribose pyrophosphatase/nicotinamide-nucleotide amidase [Ktedonobacterales bacterium]|jgi:nicotinamide-nucleotide amidase|nr:MAG: ADP-ribose pyrophosphatase/nicotinamide-nucleotide amidase [Ktedonobacterales bacterium]